MLFLLLGVNALPAQKTITMLTPQSNDTMDDTCQTFCAINTESWNTKCAWGSKQCSGCDSCSHGSVTNCQNWCGPNTETWYSKCRYAAAAAARPRARPQRSANRAAPPVPAHSQTRPLSALAQVELRRVLELRRVRRGADGRLRDVVRWPLSPVDDQVRVGRGPLLGLPGLRPDATLAAGVTAAACDGLAGREDV